MLCHAAYWSVSFHLRCSARSPTRHQYRAGREPRPTGHHFRCSRNGQTAASVHPHRARRSRVRKLRHRRTSQRCTIRRWRRSHPHQSKGCLRSGRTVRRHFVLNSRARGRSPIRTMLSSRELVQGLVESLIKQRARQQRSPDYRRPPHARPHCRPARTRRQATGQQTGCRWSGHRVVPVPPRHSRTAAGHNDQWNCP